MSRELIVSVNGREKKIAIVENERVTEFYIERGEQNQGIVGNIYKGRVMRVLPGMQSAFVDIGLDRDAFLYVTDFFDEEAEFERIVVDKSKKGDAAAAARAAAEQIEIGRVQREQQVEATHERAEPLRELEPGVIAADEKTDEAAEGGAARGRGRRGGRGRTRAAKSTPADIDERSIIPTQAEPIDTPFVMGGASFERISDDEERAMNGEMFKDARLQERIMDAVHAVEFDLEDVPTAAVGSLLSEGINEGGGFQRIADEDDTAPTQRRAPQIEAAHLDHFDDEVNQDRARDTSFQRVSDDEETQVTASASPSVSETPAAKEPSDRRRKRTGVIGRLFKSKKVEDEEASAEAATEAAKDFMPDAEASITTGRPHEEFATRRGGRRRRRPSSKRAPGEADGANGADESPDEAREESGADIEPIEVQATDSETEPVVETDEASEASESPEPTRQRRSQTRSRRRP
ncbi:MAG TPA: hypothetical protein VE863_13330, partial [Pyrinomonadaceae bacterium]|nr:hypothetical protein [Pyrinomonadaceae bacterium]